jgi:hypothetical protein
VNFDGKNSWSGMPQIIKDQAGPTITYTEEDLPPHLESADFYFKDVFK